MKIEAKLADKYNYQPLQKELSEKYRQFFTENIPEFLEVTGDNICLSTLKGSKICTGYKRIVVGDYGAFVEFSPEQSYDAHFRIKKGQEYRVDDPRYSDKVKFIWLTVNDGSDVKIYFQKRGVRYADYKPEMYYVSVHECKLEGGK